MTSGAGAPAAIDVPDVPRWVEAHGIAGDREGWRREVGGGIALGHDAAKLIVLVGDVESAAARALAVEHPEHTVLFAIERDDLRGALERPVSRAMLLTQGEHAHATAPISENGAVLLDDTGAAALPAALWGELAWARTRGPVWCAWLDGAPASLAYAPWRSARWFDISVDTLPGARQLGLATIVAAAMIDAERAQGREPVWGADAENAASLALARRLGFEPFDELWVAACAR